MAYIQKNNPFPITSCGRRRSFMNNNVRRQVNSPGKDRTEESPFKKTPAWQRKEGKNPTGGLNKKGREAYKRDNPGSTLSAPVTKDPSKLKKGSKAAKRRKSFCARMSGMPGPMMKNGKPTRKKLALDKWNC